MIPPLVEIPVENGVSTSLPSVRAPRLQERSSEMEGRAEARLAYPTGSRMSSPAAPPFRRPRSLQVRSFAAAVGVNGAVGRIIFTVLIALSATLASPAFAQVDAGAPAHVAPLGFQLRVDPKQVKLGEPFVYTLELTHKPSQRYELRTPTDLGPFEILDVSRKRADAADKATTVFLVKMSVFELGKKTLPDLEFDVFDAGVTSRFIAPGIDIECVSTLPQDAEQKGENLYDIKPPEDVPVRSYRLLWGLLAAAAVAAAGYALFRYLRRPRATLEVARPLAPLDVRTVTALDALRTEDLPGKGQVRDFYFRLSEILRGYLGERFGFEALECTSSELLERLRLLHTPGLDGEGMRRFVADSDLAKFAKHAPTAEECKGSLEFAYQVVHRTWPPPAPVPSTPALPVAPVTNAQRPDVP